MLADHHVAVSRNINIRTFNTELPIHNDTGKPTSDRSTCLSLSLVSSWTRDLALPHLLSVIVFNDRPESTVIAFCNSICSTPSYTTFIRHLWLHYTIQYNTELGLIFETFAKCHNVSNIALSDTAFTYLLLNTSGYDGPPFLTLHPRDIHITVLVDDHTWNAVVTWLPVITSPSPLFSMITHLHFTDVFSYKVQLDISAFPSLTHLAIPLVRAQHVFDSLDHLIYPVPLFQKPLMAPRLRCLVFTLPSLEGERTPVPGLLRKMRRDDIRVYWAFILSACMRDEWTKEAKGGESIWERAVRLTNEDPC